MKNLILSQLFILLLCCGNSLMAQSAQLSIQGVLRNANGTAVANGQYEINFKLWDTATGGTLVWEETKSDVDVEGGIYSVVLGDGSTVLDAPFDQPYYIGVSVEGGAELIPRAPLTSSPYALSLIGSDNIFPNSGNVGVGDASPQSKLSVKEGNGTIGLEPGANANHTAKIKTTTTGLDFLNENGKATTFSNDDGEKMRIAGTGNVGIGTLNPSRKLHLKGSNDMLFLEGDGTSFMSFYKNGLTARSGYFGYPNAGTNSLRLVNEIGDLSITSSNFNLSSTVLEVNSNGGMFRLKGTDHAYLEFYPQANQGRKGYIGYGGANQHLSITNEYTNGNVSLSATQDIHMHTGSNRGIYMHSLIVANGGKYHSMNEYGHLNPGATGIGYVYGHQSETNHPYSIAAANYIRAEGFHADSDRRIKKDIKISEGKKDLALLNTIEVTDYRHIDEVKNSPALRKGFIAQQVESVFPQAIERSSEHIPSVFTFPISLSLENGVAQFDLAKTHDLNAGDNVKIMTADGEEFFEVAAIVNEKSFTINNWKGSQNANELFVYGKKVDDFRSVDYDRVFTLAVSATQELARKVEALEKENAALKTKASQSIKVNQELKAEVETLAKRMIRLENQFEN